jgi:hypothetical protein
MFILLDSSIYTHTHTHTHTHRFLKLLDYFISTFIRFFIKFELTVKRIQMFLSHSAKICPKKFQLPRKIEKNKK